MFSMGGYGLVRKFVLAIVCASNVILSVCVFGVLYSELSGFFGNGGAIIMGYLIDVCWSVETRNSAFIALLAWRLCFDHRLVDVLLEIAGLGLLFDALSEHFLAAVPIAGSCVVGGLFAMNILQFTTLSEGLCFICLLYS